MSYKQTELFVAMAKTIRYGSSMIGGFDSLKSRNSNNNGQHRAAMVNWSGDGNTIAGLYDRLENGSTNIESLARISTFNLRLLIGTSVHIGCVHWFAVVTIQFGNTGRSYDQFAIGTEA